MSIELVYMTPFVGIEMRGKTPHYKYRKINGMTDVNKRTKDKNKFAHCYDQLIPGKNYVVVTENKSPHRNVGRWVFTECYELPEASTAADLCTYVKRLDPTSKVPGYRTTSDIFKQAATQVVKVWKAKQALKRAQEMIADVLVF